MWVNLYEGEIGCMCGKCVFREGVCVCVRVCVCVCVCARMCGVCVRSRKQT